MAVVIRLGCEISFVTIDDLHCAKYMKNNWESMLLMSEAEEKIHPIEVNNSSFLFSRSQNVHEPVGRCQEFSLQLEGEHGSLRCPEQRTGDREEHFGC